MNNPPPSNILNRMSPTDRAKLGKAGRTTEEINAANELKSERELHNQICNWLQLHEIPFIRARMDRKSPLPVGWPDFTIFGVGEHCLIECKAEKGKLSSAQEKCIKRLKSLDHTCWIIFTFEQFISIMRHVAPLEFL